MKSLKQHINESLVESIESLPHVGGPMYLYKSKDREISYDEENEILIFTYKNKKYRIEDAGYEEVVDLANLKDVKRKDLERLFYKEKIEMLESLNEDKMALSYKLTSNDKRSIDKLWSERKEETMQQIKDRISKTLGINWHEVSAYLEKNY